MYVFVYAKSQKSPRILYQQIEQTMSNFNQTTNEAAQFCAMCIFTIVLIAMVCINLLKSN